MSFFRMLSLSLEKKKMDTSVLWSSTNNPLGGSVASLQTTWHSLVKWFTYLWKSFLHLLRDYFSRVQGGHSYQVNLHSSYEQSITSLLLKINTGFKRFILYHKHTQTHPFFNITLRIFLQINQQCRKIRVKNIQKTKRNICTETFCLSFFQVEVGRSVSCTVATFF